MWATSPAGRWRSSLSPTRKGSRFPPYAMGSLVYVGGLALADAYAIRGIDGRERGRGAASASATPVDAQPGWLRPHAYLELHIEQGPILEDENRAIGAVEGITGLTWTEVTVTGCSGHAGTTPMHLRHDAALCLGRDHRAGASPGTKIGGHQKATVGRIELYPNLVNVIAERAVLDHRPAQHRSSRSCEAAERQLTGSLARLARAWERVDLDPQPRTLRAGRVSGRDRLAGGDDRA